MSDELKPCPFCGGAARIESNRDWHLLYAAHDDDCVLDADAADLRFPAQPGYLIEIAEVWNRRATSGAASGEVAHICRQKMGDGTWSQWRECSAEKAANAVSDRFAEYRAVPPFAKPAEQSAPPVPPMDQSSCIPPFAEPAGQQEITQVWLPIETAPKSLQPIWLGCHRSMRIGFWSDGQEYEHHGSIGGGWRDLETGRDLCFAPTSWAALPPVPSEQSAPAGSACQGGNTKGSDTLAASQAAPAKAEGWISCAERLPEVETDVLVYGKRADSMCYSVAGIFNGNTFVLPCTLNNSDWMAQDSELELRFVVSHWQPLPSPPSTPLGEQT